MDSPAILDYPTTSAQLAAVILIRFELPNPAFDKSVPSLELECQDDTGQSTTPPHGAPFSEIRVFTRPTKCPMRNCQ